MSDERELKIQLIQAKLAMAQELLKDATALANQAAVNLDFMGMKYDSSFGWVSQGGELIEASEWNSSSCSIDIEKVHNPYWYQSSC
jgi:hypothetical protein